MYVVPPPDGSDPAAGPAEGAAMVRTYRAWKGSNIFFLQGRFIFGPDVRSLFLTIFLIVAPVAVFCAFVARHLMDDLPHNSGIAIMAVVIAFTIYILVLLLLISGRDPGIVPRNMRPPKPEGYDGSEDGSGQMVRTPQLHFPRTRDVVVNGITVKVKYCDTCMLYRPPRCSHCSICNNCVERFDHHCPWVGQCIGQRNYRFFFMFVFSTTLLCLYVFGFCWLYIKRIMDGEETTIWKAMAKTPASIVLIVYTFIAVWFVGGLSGFHLYLISTNQSTYENFRYQYDRRGNPYNKGVIGNFKEIFCTSIPTSKNNFRAKVPKEPGILARTVSGSFVSSNLGKDTNDVAMGRKPAWDEATAEAGEYGGQIRIDDGVDKKDGKFTDASSYSSRALPAEGTEGPGTGHPTRSSWGRKSGSWDTSPEVVAKAAEVGGSNRVSGSSTTALTTPTSSASLLPNTSPSTDSTL